MLLESEAEQVALLAIERHITAYEARTGRPYPFRPASAVALAYAAQRRLDELDLGWLGWRVEVELDGTARSFQVSVKPRQRRLPARRLQSDAE